MNIYQLVVKGKLAVLMGNAQMVSKRVFYNLDDATKYKPEFIKLCTTSQTKYDLRYLKNDETLYVEICSLELG